MVPGSRLIAAEARSCLPERLDEQDNGAAAEKDAGDETHQWSQQAKVRLERLVVLVAVLEEGGRHPEEQYCCDQAAVVHPCPIGVLNGNGVTLFPLKVGVVSRIKCRLCYRQKIPGALIR